MSTLISNDGTFIAYEKRGTGPAVILVDGALCHRAFGPARPLAKLLSEHFTVYAYDRRGRGESGDTRPYAVEREVEDIEALVKEAGGSAYLYGISSGGMLALEAAAQIGGVRRLAIYEVPMIVDDTHPPRPDDYLATMDGLVAANRPGDAVKLFMRTVGMPGFMVALFPLMPAWKKLKAVGATLPNDFRILGDSGSGKPLPADRWARATVSTLVMDGGKSPTYMRNAQRQLAQVLQNAEYRTLEGQTHMLKPEAVAPALVEFFRD